MLAPLRHMAERGASRATRLIGGRRSDGNDYVFVSEFPKSGGTWVAQMLSTYLGRPFPQHKVLPYPRGSVVQNHWDFDPRLRRVVYVFRDGRDVMVSLFFDRLRIAHHSGASGRHRVGRVYERALGAEYRADDIVALLPRFIEFEATHPGRGASTKWSTHVSRWMESAGDRVVPLSYESLLEDCVGAMGSTIEAVAEETVDRERLAAVVDQFSMVKQTGRRPGEEDPTQHIRKGVAGDWRSHFSRAAAEVFDRFHGETLVAVGYDVPGWVDRYSYVTP